MSPDCPIARLQVNGKPAAKGKSAGAIPQMPQDGLEVGRAENGEVGSYQVPNTFKGEITGLTIELGK